MSPFIYDRQIFAPTVRVVTLTGLVTLTVTVIVTLNVKVFLCVATSNLACCWLKISGLMGILINRFSRTVKVVTVTCIVTVTVFLRIPSSDLHFL